MGDDGDDDYIFYGKTIVKEDELQGRKKKTMAVDTGQIRKLPPWKQEVTDEEGRRRFHGAFTGGFSAGYYNSVGSKEGWTPQAFTSSRKKRAEVKGQTIYNFLDEDEKVEFGAQKLSTSSQFDTFGFTSAEVARKKAEKELQTRPSAIPGPLPDEIIVPAPESIGVKLLVKMGWRQGRSIGARHIAAISESRREARKAFLALSEKDEPRVERPSFMQNKSPGDDKTNGSEEDNDTTVHVPCSTPVFVIHPKNDLYGLGYDPFKNAPEFRERKDIQNSREKEKSQNKTNRLQRNLFRPNAGKIATGFGIGALEDLDEEDEDIYANDISIAPEEDALPLHGLEPMKELPVKQHGDMLPGFKLASVSSCRAEWFNPPVIPSGFAPKHKFSASLEVERKVCELPPPEGAPPDDSELRLMIEGLAKFVAKSGKVFEDLSREKNTNNPLFSFLSGGPGHDYYRRKLWEEQKKLAESGRSLIDNLPEKKRQKMDSEERGRVLGETPLERSSNSASASVPPGDVARLQSVLSDTFTKPTSLLENAAAFQPFGSDPAKQARFEQFLRDKYQGGLRSMHLEGHMSELERAQERLDFEAAVETITKGNQSKESSISTNQHLDLVSTVGNRFTSGGVETMGPMLQQRGHEKGANIEAKHFPQRKENQWRPASLLCKRFNLLDPYAGKPPPLPKARSKMDSFILISNPVGDSAETSSVNEDRSNVHQPHTSQSQLEPVNTNVEDIDKEESVEVDDVVVKKPVDLYKAIFSDESDTEAEEADEKQLDIQEKNAQGANATLNRLIAGDFLESLGKELGLRVPPALDPTQKGKSVPIYTTESKEMTLVESSTETDRLMSLNCSVQKDSNKSLNVNLEIYHHLSLNNDQKEAKAHGIHEAQSNKDSICNEENTVQCGNGKSDSVDKSSRHDALDSSSPDYDGGKDNVKHKKRKRESGHRGLEKSHTKRHHRQEHKSQDKYRREKRDRDKNRHEHKKHKKRRHRHRRNSSPSSSSSGYST